MSKIIDPKNDSTATTKDDLSLENVQENGQASNEWKERLQVMACSLASGSIWGTWSGAMIAKFTHLGDGVPFVEAITGNLFADHFFIIASFCAAMGNVTGYKSKHPASALGTWFAVTACALTGFAYQGKQQPPRDYPETSMSVLKASWELHDRPRHFALTIDELNNMLPRLEGPLEVFARNPHALDFSRVPGKDGRSHFWVTGYGTVAIVTPEEQKISVAVLGQRNEPNVSVTINHPCEPGSTIRVEKNGVVVMDGPQLRASHYQWGMLANWYAAICPLNEPSATDDIAARSALLFALKATAGLPADKINVFSGEVSGSSNGAAYAQIETQPGEDGRPSVVTRVYVRFVHTNDEVTIQNPCDSENPGQTMVMMHGDARTDILRLGS